MKTSKTQRDVLHAMGARPNALVNGDEGTPQWWIDGGGAVRKSTAAALIKRKLVELTGRAGGHPGVLYFTATTAGRVAGFRIKSDAVKVDMRDGK